MATSIITRRRPNAHDFHVTLRKGRRFTIIYNSEDQQVALAETYRHLGKDRYRIKALNGAFMGWALKRADVLPIVAARIGRVG